MNQNSQSPSWGAPAGAAWGSPLVNASRPGRNSPNTQHTPVRHDRDNNSSMNRRDSYPRSQRGGNFNNSPGPFGYSPSPRHFQPRPRYQSSPAHNGGTPHQRFGFHNSSQEFTPSPHHRGNGSFGSPRRSFPQRGDRSMNNPGGSSNISDYIHPSMLEDPWKDLKPMPLFRQY